MHRTALGLVFLLIGSWPSTASAEGCREAPRVRAAVLGAAALESSDAHLAAAGSLGYRFDRCFGAEVEIGVVPDLDDLPQFDSRVITFMGNVRAEIPTAARAIVPYVVGGGGIALVTADLVLVSPVTGSFVPSGSRTTTDTAPALNVGGGISVRLFKRLWADVDMRYVRVFTDSALNLNRFGAGVSYHF